VEKKKQEMTPELKREIVEEFQRHRYLLESEAVSDEDKALFDAIKCGKAGVDDYSGSLKFLSRCLYQATGKRTVILIDEYDVPLENAYFRGFYVEMVDFIRSLFESALINNDHLQLAVITGCLRI